ncbi:MAG: hemoblobin-interacting domain-containing protein [Syntrophomonas sp.]
MVFRKNIWGKLIALGFMLALLLGVGGLIIPGTASAEIAVTITGDGVNTETTFTQADLEAMTQVQAQYSAINTYPTKKLYVGRGVKLADLLTAAGIKDDARLITVTATDGFSMTFTKAELLEDTRYYYPGLKENAEYDGWVAGSPDGAVAVDAILALSNADGTSFDNLSTGNAPVLMIGQRWITEQTANAFVKYVGTVEVSTATPEKWENPAATPDSGTIAEGTQVTLSTSDMNEDSIYYTTDGSDPTFASSMYNWIKKRWWSSRSDDLATINHPISISQDVTIKAVAVGFGKEDSDIVSFTYQVSPAPVLLTPEVTSRGDVSLTFNKAMSDPTGIDAEDQFTVLVDGQSVAVTAVVKTNTAEKIKLELATKVIGGQVVTVAYSKSDDLNKQVKAADGNAVESFSAQNVTNGLTPPATFVLTADTSDNTLGQAIDITFTDDAAWRAAITGITVNGTPLSSEQYTLSAGNLNITASIFTAAGDYTVVVTATGYEDATVTQHITSADGVFTVSGSSIASHSYSLAELKAMTATTATYGSKSCTGVALGNLLTGLGITDGTCTVAVNTADNYETEPILVSDILDPANNYLLTYAIDGSDIVIDGDKYLTPLRLYHGTASNTVYKHVESITISAGSVAPETWTDYTTTKQKGTSDPWTIAFNKEVDPSSITGNIYVATDEAGTSKVTGVLAEPVQGNAHQVQVSPPENGWQPGQTYYLFISSRVQSSGGKTLNSGIRMCFTVN